MSGIVNKLGIVKEAISKELGEGYFLGWVWERWRKGVHNINLSEGGV